jgi:hypothetical protein
MSVAISLYERWGPIELIPVQLRTITEPILAGVPSWAYTDRGQIPSKHKVGGSNPSRGTSVQLTVAAYTRVLVDWRSRS